LRVFISLLLKSQPYRTGGFAGSLQQRAVKHPTP
jgi:hypothetical protein